MIDGGRLTEIEHRGTETQSFFAVEETLSTVANFDNGWNGDEPLKILAYWT
ncbi:MAG: hypothetical protein R3E32_26770 [Chitinophagales bacterium]